jgi:DNA helicase HerA-like ATPase
LTKHLLFADIAPAVQQKIEQVVRLIRSKGVGVYFVSQNPLDIPDVVLGQLGNRVQHALRAFTPRDQKAVKAAAETFRQNPNLKVEAVLTNLRLAKRSSQCWTKTVVHKLSSAQKFCLPVVRSVRSGQINENRS